MKQRSSNIELLRLLCLLGVVIMHYSDKVIPLYDNSDNIIYAVFFRSLASSSVDIFLIISGYFMCTSDRRTYGKPINLMLQVCVYNELAYLTTVALGLFPLTLRSICSSLVPDSYYSILFVILYFISPYINKILSSLSHHDWKVFMTILLCFFSFLSLVTPVLRELTGNVWMGTSGVGAWGSQQGFNIVNFILCYCVGAFLRLGQLPKCLQNQPTVAIIWFVTLTVICFWAFLLQGIHSGQMRSAWVYDSPLVILFGVTSFLLAKSITFHSAIVNKLAVLVYPMFLIHCHFMRYLPYADLVNQSFFTLMAHYVGFVIIMFMLTMVVYGLYNAIFGRIINKLDQHEIQYFKK